MQNVLGLRAGIYRFLVCELKVLDFVLINTTILNEISYHSLSNEQNVNRLQKVLFIIGKWIGSILWNWQILAWW